MLRLVSTPSSLGNGWLKWRVTHRRRRRGQGEQLPPPQIRAKTIFFGQKSCKIRAFCYFFSGIYHVKFGNFVNFSGKSRVKFGHFVKFSCIFSGKNVLPSQSWLSSYAYGVTWPQHFPSLTTARSCAPFNPVHLEILSNWHNCGLPRPLSLLSSP